MFMDDNARPHRAQIFDDFLKEDNIRRMDLLSRSPYLNPIEQVWDGLGRAIAQRNPPPNTHQEIKAALLEEWALLSQAFIDTLINSMKARYEACIPVHGGHIP
ncbi:Transposable element Tc3 transposase like protein [Argiope bruennichi]|uniref:Transposable element Tc3 transposase like protein n=1 Tax=Argiope bruennichi TaxID=94029 RepID=A0A8T0FHQ0_ARGBR|nr:Transposable element Tc3 transposase like protein [Argiope bruennichi]